MESAYLTGEGRNKHNEILNLNYQSKAHTEGILK